MIKRDIQSKRYDSNKLSNIKNAKFLACDKALIKRITPILYQAKTLENTIGIGKNRKIPYEKLVSIGQFFYIHKGTICNSTDLMSDVENFIFPFSMRKIDATKGIFKDDYIIYQIIDIEYEDYDKLKEFLKEEKIFNTYKFSLKNSYVNAFYIDENTEISINEPENFPLSIQANITSR